MTLKNEKTLAIATKVVGKGKIKQNVFDLLKKNLTYSTRKICQLLHLNYNDYKRYIWFLRSKYKKQLKFGLGLKGLKTHHWHGFLYSLKSLNNKQGWKKALQKGWIQSKSKNHLIYWKEKRGRLEWFRTGRINIWVNKPVSLGKFKQLMANAFFSLDLINDIRVFTKWISTMKQKSAHYVFETNQPLPYNKIILFRETNGVVIKTGDKSHPSSIEIEVSLPDWVERIELLTEQNIRVLEQFSKFMASLSQPKPLSENGYKMIS